MVDVNAEERLGFDLKTVETFKDPSTKEFFPAWVDHYERLGVPIPEGVPGCKPGGLSRASAIAIIWRSDQL